MELKEYQQGVLQKLETYLRTLQSKHEDANDFVEFQKSKGKTVSITDYCRDTWDQLNHERLLPYLKDAQSNTIVAPYLSRHDGLHHSIPNICFKVPTGGGKTLLAAASIERIQTDYFKRQTGFVLWVVPTETIYRQTWKQLANREHPYRQMLERASGGRVKVLEKNDAFTCHDIESQLCIMVLMLPSANRQSKETLRMFRDSGRFSSFFPAEDDSNANRDLHNLVTNLDCNDLADTEWAGTLSIKHSLGNVLRLVRPIILIDEGHKAYSDSARETLCGFNPRFILELSATPNTNGKHQSNVLVNVPGAALKDEEMIKLPINIINESGQGDWKHTLTLAHDKLDTLQTEAQLLHAENGRYIRPILLIRVERTGQDQRDSGFVHAEDAREYLQEKLAAKPEEIRLKTSDNDEIGDEDLLADICPVRYIITKDALREGWDCPFAYVLVVLSKTTANTALTQMIGRVLRQPHAQLTHHPLLDECYVYTFDQDVTDAVDGVRKGLQEEGMADLASSVKAIDPNSGKPRNMRLETLKRRKEFEALKIFLPRILYWEGKPANNYRAFDYDRDILGKLNWDQFSFDANHYNLNASESIRRTTARIDIDKQGLQTKQPELISEDLKIAPDQELDIPFLVRQLLDVIPNPWQGVRILQSALETLRKNGASEEQLFTNRLDLLRNMKIELRKQVNNASENLFRANLEVGIISFHLVSAHNAELNWALAKTLEIDLSDEDRELCREDGNELKKSLFEPVYRCEFNELEKNTAWYLDDKECVYWWHRVAVNQRSYSLQGWQRQRVYPDLLACIHGAEKGKFRFSVLETKGEHLKGNEDTEYKKKLFALLSEYAGKAVRVGELELKEEPLQMTFTMLMENSWKQQLQESSVV